jgi:hypothetical protein
MIAIRLALLASVLSVASCGEDADTLTSASTTEPTTILFAGILQPRGTRFYSYTVTTAGIVSAMLASLEQGHTPMTHPLELGIGIPAGTGCAVPSPTLTTTSLVPQIRQDSSIGTYCVRIADTAGLPGPMNFTIRVVHP